MDERERGLTSEHSKRRAVSKIFHFTSMKANEQMENIRKPSPIALRAKKTSNPNYSNEFLTADRRRLDLNFANFFEHFIIFNFYLSFSLRVLVFLKLLKGHEM